MFANLLFAALLLIAAFFLARHSRRGWRSACDRGLNSDERAFHSRRHRRRLGIAAIVAVVALAVPFSTQVGTPLIAEFYLVGLLAAVLLMLVLALLDVLSTRTFFQHERKRLDQAREDLEVELEQARQKWAETAEGNGQSD